MRNIPVPLVEWFRKNKRDLPWRGTVTPYQIWISEIMLQQTRVEAVKPYYTHFLAELPDFNALADVSDERLYKLWEGLGYYSRAKNLKKCAKQIVDKYSGEFPKTYKDALSLPGIGIYTAGAILSRAYGEKIAAVDGNVLRVLTRYEENDMDILKDTTKLYYKDKLEPIIPESPGEFNEALMELGATICMPKIALCDQCPLQDNCKAHKNNTIFQYPYKKPKKEKVNYEYSVFFITDGSKYIFINKEDGVLKGLASPLLYDSFISLNDICTYLEDNYSFHVKNVIPIREDKHIFSHQVWYMRAYIVAVESILDFKGYTKKEIQENLGLPTCYRKFIDDLY